MRTRRLTILHLTDTSLEVVDAQVAHLVANIVPIHSGDVVVVYCGSVTGR